MLIAFEGQDGSGKTTLLAAVQRELERLDVPVCSVPEFSDSPIGVRLLDALARDKFLRARDDDEATPITRALDIVADLYYLDERVIGPALERGAVVLKDRHVDTVLSTVPPMLVQAGVIEADSFAFTWLALLVGELRNRPAVTVYVDAPLNVRLERIKRRTRHLPEHRAHEVDSNDLEVFARRERIMRAMIQTTPNRFLTINNGRVPLEEGVRTVTAFVLAALKNRKETGEAGDG
jgi:thymidylate kinase